LSGVVPFGFDSIYQLIDHMWLYELHLSIWLDPPAHLGVGSSLESFWILATHSASGLVGCLLGHALLIRFLSRLIGHALGRSLGQTLLLHAQRRLALRLGLYEGMYLRICFCLL
jgi:hypothetical protein